MVALEKPDSIYQAIDFFSGIGGWRIAMNCTGGVVAAYDISEVANDVYRLNFGESPKARDLSSISKHEISTLNADTWLLSPPCQPFCRMGLGRGLGDARSAAFAHLMGLLPLVRPRRLVLENVEGFLESQAFTMLVERMESIGLEWRSFRLCSSQFGIPNRRPRVFVVASSSGVKEEILPSREPGTISGYLDVTENENLYISNNIADRHVPGMDIVTPDSCRSSCFIGGYGKRYVGSGSFLLTQKGVRRFSPSEICRLMGYPVGFSFPPGLPLVKQYKLLGNGLNLVVARWVLGQLA